MVTPPTIDAPQNDMENVVHAEDAEVGPVDVLGVQDGDDNVYDTNVLVELAVLAVGQPTTQR
jgi:hypothetical protein